MRSFEDNEAWPLNQTEGAIGGRGLNFNSAAIAQFWP
jgi:hypothetical protein